MTKIADYKLRKKCRICRSTITKFLSLGNTPLADSFLTSPDRHEQKFPLELAFCNNCKLVQLTGDVNSKLLFGADYAFYSSGSPASIEYFRRYAQDVLLRFPEQSKGLILEIASNDGILLKYLKDEGCQVLGIDPATNVAQEAIKRGVPTIVTHFDKNTAKKILKKASIILANNVVAHIEDLNGFMSGVKQMLTDNGVFIFEVQYLPQLIFNNQFDHIYHEHRSFFALRPLIHLLTKFDLTIFDVHQQYAQGGSIRVFAAHTTNSKRIDKSVSDIARKELSLLHLDSLKTYQEFASRIRNLKRELILILEDLKNKNKKIYGLGASAKGNTLLNYCEINRKVLNCIIDKTPFKFNKFTPGTHIPVFPPEKLTEIGHPDYYLLLVWNYLPQILEREMDFIKKGGHFIVPIPRPYII